MRACHGLFLSRRTRTLVLLIELTHNNLLSKLTNLFSCCCAMLSYAKDRSRWQKAQSNNKAHHDWPAADAHPAVEGRGQQDEQQQREEESGAADELEGVEAEAAGAAVDQLLQEQGHQGQQLEEHNHHNNFSHCTPCCRCSVPQLPV